MAGAFEDGLRRIFVEFSVGEAELAEEKNRAFAAFDHLDVFAGGTEAHKVERKFGAGERNRTAISTLAR